MVKNMLAYLAGFFDGEGSIFIRKTRTRYYLVTSPIPKTAHSYVLSACAFNNCHQPLQLLVDTFGGFIYKRTDCRGLTWIAHAQVAARALEKLLPYLLIKHEQAILALDFAKQMRRRGRTVVTQKEIETRDEFKRKISELAGRYNSHGPTLQARQKS